MVELGWLQEVANTSFPFALVLIIGLGLRRMWADLWPWWCETYWPDKQRRYGDMQETQRRRDEMYAETTKDFLETIRRYENGSSAINTREHEMIVRHLQELQEVVRELCVLLRHKLESGGTQNVED